MGPKSDPPGVLKMMRDPSKEKAVLEDDRQSSRNGSGETMLTGNTGKLDGNLTNQSSRLNPPETSRERRAPWNRFTWREQEEEQSDHISRPLFWLFTTKTLQEIMLTSSARKSRTEEWSSGTSYTSGWSVRC